MSSGASFKPIERSSERGDRPPLLCLSGAQIKYRRRSDDVVLLFALTKSRFDVFFARASELDVQYGCTVGRSI
jgi:hypothetical protein